jgi:hypothetical protein
VGLLERIKGPARATVTSLGGIGANVVTLGVYATYGAASPHASHGVLFALLTLPYLLIAVLVARRRPYTARP